MIASGVHVPRIQHTATPAQQWMPQGLGDPRSEYGYGNDAGMLLLADELNDKFSELGRASLIEKCFGRAQEGTNSSLIWALCGSDVKALDMKKLEGELKAEGITAEPVLESVKATLEHAQKVGAAVEAAAKDDPGLATFLKVSDTAKAEWATYLAKNKADFDRYLALEDGVRSGKSNNKAFVGCYEATLPAFTKLVKATAPKIPWEVGNDELPGYMSYMVATTEGYIASVAWAACAWSIHSAGEAAYVAAANRSNGGTLRAGWRTLTLAKMLDPGFKPKFADRSLKLESWTFEWKYGVKMAGVNDIVAIMTPAGGEIATLKPKDDVTMITFNLSPMPPRGHESYARLHFGPISVARAPQRGARWIDDDVEVHRRSRSTVDGARKRSDHHVRDRRLLEQLRNFAQRSGDTAHEATSGA